MESADETRRLLAQEEAQRAEVLLRAAGLKEGDVALDAGCGPGGITDSMAGIVGALGSVTGLDMSPERLDAARSRNAHHPHVRFVQGDIRATGLPDATFDFTWSQFVLEYLPDRQRALAELVRVTRPGGRIAVSEIDGFGLNNWPFPPALRDGAERFAHAVAAAGLDIFVGRKLFADFRSAGLLDVRVHLFPMYVIPGRADTRTMEDWRTRFEALASAVAPAFGGQGAYQAFCESYLGMLADPDTLKYSVVLVTEGGRP